MTSGQNSNHRLETTVYILPRVMADVVVVAVLLEHLAEVLHR